ncbi:TlpA disulfide reductase family protein [Chitinophaga flava]|uniref:Thioredoxin domain-containing protein n=1 Tax=Chitinophaga flava TaxID=2259036 RepID=A0A365XTQ8_9BACT|nr:TlpA disulfide reductase family protein [Chitinophaga flava]RBL89530.1 hypothetical protein DF182_23755 [Chitinophaga flava]
MNINKRMMLMITAVLAGSVSIAQQPYQLSGKLPGVADGVKVYLEDIYSSKKYLDSAVTRDGEFVIRGTHPWGMVHHCRLLIDRNPGVKKDSKQVILFMGDENVQLSVPHIDSMPGYYYNTGGSKKNVRIEGAAEQALYETFQAENQSLSASIGEWNDQYMREYHLPALDGKFNTARGIELMRAIKNAETEMNTKKMAFIKQHPKNLVSVFMAQGLLYTANSQYTAKEIDELVNSLDGSLAASPAMKAMKEVAVAAKVVAKGTRFIDIPLIDAAGKPVKLAKYVKPGQYNMLEFWASWCGPCRGEIPHLRHLNEVVSNKDFNIISISIDEKNADWLKALKEEKMVWTQLCDTKGFNGPVSRQYKVSGVPFSVVLDKNGRVVSSNIRGGELDMVLKDLLGEKITAF